MKKNRGLFRLIFNSIVYFLIAIFVIVSLFTIFTINKVIAESPKLDIEKINSYEPTKILDNQDQLVSVLGGEVRENVSYSDLPQVVIDAFLAVEDSRFEAHNGFDIPRFLKSFLVNIKAGGIEQGGSTITMQLVDNSYFNADQSKQTIIQKLKQKISEITMAMELEKKTSKQDILTAYLNKINFGENIRGIGKASEYYFGKHVSQLNMSEASFLAGVINAPNLFNPYNGVVKDEKGKVTDYYSFALKRRDTTLYLMKLHGYITDTEYELAKATPLAFQLSGKSDVSQNNYLAYTEIVEKEVMELTGKNPHTVPMTIYTALDRKTQDLSNEISQKKHVTFINHPALQVGSAVIDNINHELIAINPGFGEYKGDARKNFGYVEKNQVGSTSKPIISYTPAFDHLGYSTGHTFTLKPLSYRGTDIKILDYYDDKKKYSFEETVAYSLNKTSVETFYRIWDKIGLNGYNQLVKNLGLDTPDVTDQFAIGGGEFKLSPYELAGAYSAIASKGQYVKPTTVRKVVIHATGETFTPEKVKAQPYSEEAAYLMTTLLERAVTGGYSNGLWRLRNEFPVYAKSGTSDWGKDGVQYGIPVTASRDLWIAAFSGNTTVATWVGFDTRKLDSKSYFTFGESSTGMPHQVTKLLMTAATKGRENVKISKPEGVTTLKHVKGLYPYMHAPDTLKDLAVTGLIKRSSLSNVRQYEQLNIPTTTTFNITVDDARSRMQFTFDKLEKNDLLGTVQYVVEIKNKEGKEVFKKEFTENVGVIEIDQYPDGVYTVTGSYKFSEGALSLPPSSYEYTHQKTTIIPNHPENSDNGEE